MTHTIDRRADGNQVVTTGLLVQRQSGTVSAIEYLKNNDVRANVIQRVMSGAELRQADKRALDDVSIVAH
jgi:hypothetical protein